MKSIAYSFDWHCSLVHAKLDSLYLEIPGTHTQSQQNAFNSRKDNTSVCTICEILSLYIGYIVYGTPAAMLYADLFSSVPFSVKLHLRDGRLDGVWMVGGKGKGKGI